MLQHNRELRPLLDEEPPPLLARIDEVIRRRATGSGAAQRSRARRLGRAQDVYPQLQFDVGLEVASLGGTAGLSSADRRRHPRG